MRRRSTALMAATAAVVILAACAGGQNVSAIPAVKLSKPVADFQEQLVRVVDSVSPAVVQIQTAAGLGSGVVYDGKGNIITNAHVVGNFKTFKITLANGTYDGTLVGSFPANDLAVVKVKGTTPRPATFADSAKLDVGDFALAIGNPLGLRSSVTEGIVSSLGRTVSEGNGIALRQRFRRAPQSTREPGGALDLQGRVIDSDAGGARSSARRRPGPGIGFAIPSNVAKRIADQLISKGHVVKSGRAYWVSAWRRSSAAACSSPRSCRGHGKKGTPGDVILEVNGQPTPTADVLVSVLADLHGQQVPVKPSDTGGGHRHGDTGGAQRLTLARTRGACAQTCGPGAASRSPSTWSPIQLTAHTTTTVPTCRSRRWRSPARSTPPARPSRC